jgi:hypothetical protein
MASRGARSLDSLTLSSLKIAVVSALRPSWPFIDQIDDPESCHPFSDSAGCQLRWAGLLSEGRLMVTIARRAAQCSDHQTARYASVSRP